MRPVQITATFRSVTICINSCFGYVSRKVGEITCVVSDGDPLVVEIQETRQFVTNQHIGILTLFCFMLGLHCIAMGDF